MGKAILLAAFILVVLVFITAPLIGLALPLMFLKPKIWFIFALAVIALFFIHEHRGRF